MDKGTGQFIHDIGLELCGLSGIGMISRLHISTFVGITVIAWFVVLWIRGVPFNWEQFAPYGIVVSFLVIVVGVFDKWVW